METKRAVLFANGELRDPGVVSKMLDPLDYLVCVDGGLRHMQSLGLRPHLLIGDLDSVSAADVLELEREHVRIQRYPVEKDETDLELAILAALKEGYRTMRLIAALGGRLDQTLGNLFLLSLAELEGCDIRMEDGVEEAFIIRSRGIVLGQPGDIVSLLPLAGSVTGVVTRGLRYSLHAETLWFERTRGVSNVLVENEATIQVATGILLAIHTRHGLAS